MLHQTIKKVTEDTDSMSFNTAIARMMEFTNFFTRCESRPIEAMKTFLMLLSPYAAAPREELWQSAWRTGIDRQPESGRSGTRRRWSNRVSKCRCKSTAK